MRKESFATYDVECASENYSRIASTHMKSFNLSDFSDENRAISMANGGHGVVVNGVGAPGSGTLSREERRRRRRATQKYRTAHATR